MKWFSSLKKNKIETIFLILIIFLASFLRFYRISDYMIFLGDEGRDALIVKRMIVDHKFTLLGPIASVAPFHLGPIYYYLMLPFLFIFHLNPVGPAIMVALFGVATVFLVYLTGKKFFSSFVGLTASFLYAISPLVIIHSRSSWNPNVVPFFALLTIYFLKLEEEKKKIWWLGIVGFLLGICLQLHYICVFLIAIVVSYFLFFMPQRKKITSYFYLLGGFILGWSPFLAFEFRHNFINLKNLYWFLSSGEKVGITGRGFWEIEKNVFLRSFNDLVVAKNQILLKILIISFLFLIYRLIKKKRNFRSYGWLFFWFLGGIFLFGFFRGTIHTYYLVFMFPVPFLITALSLEKIGEIKKIGKIIAILIFLCLGWVNIKASPLKQTPNRQLYQTQEIAKFILEKTEGKPFNLALISTNNTDFAYRYFLEIWKKPVVIIEPLQIDPERKTVTSQLFVICEVKDCQPVGHSLWEIAGFGMAKIAQEWEYLGIKIYKLEHL